MKEEKKSKDLITTFKDVKINSDIELKLTKDDVINVHVVKFERAIEDELTQVRKDLVAVRVRLPETYTEMNEEADKQAKATYGGKAAKVASIINKEFGLKTESAINSSYHTVTKADITTKAFKGFKADALVVSSSAIIDNEEHGYDGRGSMRLTTNMPIIRASKKLIALYKEAGIAKKKEKSLKEKEWDLTDKLGNIDREIRKARASMTEKLMGGRGMQSLLPEKIEID